LKELQQYAKEAVVSKNAEFESGLFKKEGGQRELGEGEGDELVRRMCLTVSYRNLL
jgi:hypothetical protein